MHASTLFVLVLTTLLLALIIPACRILQQERWQMLAALPRCRASGTSWQATNLTFYGLITASSVVLGLLQSLILLRSAGVSLVAAAGLALVLLLVCVPAAGVIARRVEGKAHTFTVAGAFFLGLLCLPLVLLAVNRVLLALGQPIMEPLVVLSALAIGYVLGEGVGRLACISFGCCYGKPLANCSPFTRRLLARLAFVFDGPTKKAVYASAYGGQPLVPIQGMTCVLYTLASMAATWLHLEGCYGQALLVCLLVSQLWRVASEWLRDDFRGLASFTAYQKMSLMAVAAALVLVKLLPTVQAGVPRIEEGLTVLASPGLIIGLEIVWLLLFVHFGRSMVTTATVSFDVVQERV